MARKLETSVLTVDNTSCRQFLFSFICRDGSTIALYAAVYDGSLILTDTSVIDAIFQHINDTVLPGLKNETIDGKAIDEDYIDTVVVQELEEESKHVFAQTPRVKSTNFHED